MSTFDRETADKTAGSRQRVLALFLPIATVLYMACEGLDPRGTDQVISTTAIALKELPIAAKHPHQLFLSGTLSLLALGAVAVSYPAIATLVRTRAAKLATVAALLGAFGAFCGALVNVLVGVNVATAVTSHLTRGAAVKFLVASFNTEFAKVFIGFYFLGIFLAPVLMAIALWRSRSVQRWLAVLFLVGIEVAQQRSSSGIRSVVFMLPFALAMVLLSVRIWQAGATPAEHVPTQVVAPAMAQ